MNHEHDCVRCRLSGAGGWQNLAEYGYDVGSLLHPVYYGYQLFSQPIRESHVAHRQCEEIENLCAVPPRVGIAILSLALVVEAVHLHQQRVRAQGLPTTAWEHSKGDINSEHVTDRRDEGNERQGAYRSTVNP